MGKGKLAKFADMETYENVFQYPYSSTLWSKCGTQSVVARVPHSDLQVGEHVLSPKGESVARIPFEMQGHWREQYFHNQNPIVLELGCGKGEYTVGLAKMFPDVNFIGVDIKGARMWTGATQALQEGLKNVAFLRTNIEIIDHFFSKGEVQEIWLTFSDPQMKNPRKRLTSTWFLERYRRFLSDGGFIHLKTDSNFLFTYTSLLVEHNHLPVLVKTADLYATASKDSIAASIQTYYEGMWMARGISIKYLKFCLPHLGELTEPDVEIELDDYRSYHRDKRSSKDKAK